MSFPRYPNYKDSGVEWLGEVPEHWAITVMKRIIHMQSGEAITSESIADHGSYPVFGGNGIRGYAEQFTHDGDYVLVGRQGALCGNINYASGKFWASEHAIVLYPSQNLIVFWLGETLRAMNLNQYSVSAAQPGLSVELVSRLQLPIPTIDEQNAIAVFLARETAKIDALVAEQQRLIELLREKRQAVISHAVTKGLDPTVPMKPSGIEWLGDIPAHWKATALKRLARPGKKTFVDGDWIESPFICNDGIRLIQTGNIGIGYYKEQGYRYISESTFEELQCTEIFPRDVLICRLDGPVGRACLAPDLGVRMITSVDNAILKPSDDIFPEFVVSLLSSVPWIAWMDALCRVGGGFRLRVSRSQLGEILLPIPPFDEQVLIAQHLSTLATEWDVLTAEAERAIELLQERRTALISAAVTGQIDVRQLAQGVAA